MTPMTARPTSRLRQKYFVASAAAWAVSAFLAHTVAAEAAEEKPAPSDIAPEWARAGVPGLPEVPDLARSTPLRFAQTESNQTKPKIDEAVPSSRDELFGEPKAADSSSYKIGGFVDGLGAYTYATPAHWSRAVARFQVTAQGALSENLKWKLSGRAEVDPVYFGSDFYLDPVKRNQRLSAVWGENYLDFSAGDWNFRFGAQQIVWGEVVGLFYADVVSARDMREFLLPSFDIMRIPQAAARAEYFAGDTHLEFVWIPVPTFDRIGKPGSDFYPAPIPSPTSETVAALFRNPERPDRRLSNSNYGIRANTLKGGWDVAAFYYRSFSTQPTFYRLASLDPTQPFVFQPQYDRIWQAGGTVSKDFGEFVLRGETVYAHGQGYSVADLTAAQSVVERNTLDSIVSLDFTLPADVRLNVQGFQRVFFGGGGTDLAVRSDGFGASVLLSKKIGNAFEPQILWIHNFRGAGGLVRPRLNWYPAKNTSVGFGVDIFTGASDGFFGRYNNRDRIYAELRRDF